MSWPTELLGGLATMASHLPIPIALGWFVRVPAITGEEGHEAITRAAWEGMQLATEQERALIRGVRAPDAGLAGFLVSALPFAQRRHALRAWSGTTTAAGIRDVREFLRATHLSALALPDGSRRWAVFGEVLHCLQDSYSPAHVDRVGAVIVRMKHWGPLDPLRRRRPGAAPADEHGFPSDHRDNAWNDGVLTTEARAAVEASRRYLEIATRRSASPEAFEAFFDAFLDQHVRDSAEKT